MNKYFLPLLCCILIYGSTIVITWDCGRESAFQDIVLEKCWLNKTSRDIECVTYIDD